MDKPNIFKRKWEITYYKSGDTEKHKVSDLALLLDGNGSSTHGRALAGTETLSYFSNWF